MGKHVRTAIGATGLVALCLSAWLQAAQSATPVADAAMRGDSDAVRTLLRDGADVNAATGDGTTALHWAAMRGDDEVTAMLLYAGANVKATTRLGAYTPLHLASKDGAEPVVDALLEAGAQTGVRTSTGTTALMLAAASGSDVTVTSLLEHGADVNAVESAYGQTALMFAAALDQADVVRALLAHGADTALASTFVDLAAYTAPGEREARQPAPVAGGGRGGNAPTVSEAAGAKATTEEAEPVEVAGVTRPFRYNELIGAQGGLTALHFAARQGSMASVQALTEGGADVNLVSPGDEASPLLIATANGHFDVAMYLIGHGADPNLPSAAGATPLYAVLNIQWAPLAAYPQPTAYRQQQHSYLELMGALLETGANPNVRLNRKIWYSGYNFDQSNVDESGATPFWRAAYASDVDAMKLLVAHGADPHIPTMKPAERRRRGGGGGDEEEDENLSGLAPVPVGGPSVTPLQAAAGVGYGQGFAGNSHRFAPGGMMAAARYLVETLGADVNAVDADGNTALHHAAARGDNEMVLFLVEKGADVTAVNRKGQTTADMANGPVQRVQPFYETVALLEKLGSKNSHKCVSC